jgi:hypothetical protein
MAAQATESDNLHAATRTPALIINRAESFGAINEGPQSAMRSLSAMSKDPAS